MSQGCYYGGFEAYYSLADYSEWLYEPIIMWYNLLNNFGFIYTNIRDIHYMVIRDPRTPIKSNYSLGLAFGQLYYFVLISDYFVQVFSTINPNPIYEEDQESPLEGFFYYDA